MALARATVLERRHVVRDRGDRGGGAGFTGAVLRDAAGIPDEDPVVQDIGVARGQDAQQVADGRLQLCVVDQQVPDRGVAGARRGGGVQFEIKSSDFIKRKNKNLANYLAGYFLETCAITAGR